MTAAEKKRFYNRVRSTCLKHGVDIIYDGAIHAYEGIKLVKDNWTLAEQHCDDRGFPLSIDWKELSEKLESQGYTGGVK